MSNTQVRFRYEMVSSNGGVTIRCQVLADSDSASLTVPGRVNLEATAVSSALTLSMVIASKGTNRTKVAHARTVTIKILATRPGYTDSGLLVVPIFRLSRWQSYQADELGTYAGFPMRIISKQDGSPGANGRL